MYLPVDTFLRMQVLYKQGSGIAQNSLPTVDPYVKHGATPHAVGFLQSAPASGVLRERNRSRAGETGNGGRLACVGLEPAHIKAMGKHKATRNCAQPPSEMRALRWKEVWSPRLRQMVHHICHQQTLPGVKGRLSWGPGKALHPLGGQAAQSISSTLGGLFSPVGLHILALKPNSTVKCLIALTRGCAPPGFGKVLSDWRRGCFPDGPAWSQVAAPTAPSAGRHSV